MKITVYEKNDDLTNEIIFTARIKNISPYKVTKLFFKPFGDNVFMICEDYEVVETDSYINLIEYEWEISCFDSIQYHDKWRDLPKNEHSYVLSKISGEITENS